MKHRRNGSVGFSAFTILLAALPVFAGYNASAPKGVRRIFTQLALLDGRAVSYHVLEPGPQSIQAFPVDHRTGKLFRFPNCVGILRPVLNDSALPSPDVNHLIPDQAMREVVNVTLSSGCGVQPKSQADVVRLAVSQNSIGFVNAPGVPGPTTDSDIPTAEQQSDDELWGPVPDPGVCDVFAGCNLWPQDVQGTTQNGNALSQFVQPNFRRPRIKAYRGPGRLFHHLRNTRLGPSRASRPGHRGAVEWLGIPRRERLVLSGLRPRPAAAQLCSAGGFTRQHGLSPMTISRC